MSYHSGVKNRKGVMSCKACGRMFNNENGEDGRLFRTRPHEIVTRGAGGAEEPENQLDLCCRCHRYFHQRGRRHFITVFPHLEEAVTAASRGKA